MIKHGCSNTTIQGFRVTRSVETGELLKLSHVAMTYKEVRESMKRLGRLIGLCLVLLVTMLTVGGCGKGTGSNANSEGGTQKPIILKVGHDQPEDSSYHVGMKRFAELVAQRTGGKVKVEVFPSAQLGNEVKLLESVRLGTVDLAPCGAANASTVIPELGLFSVSYLFADQKHFNAAMQQDGEIVKKLEEIVTNKNAGVRMVGLFTTGKRSIVNKVKPIKSAADVKGLKIRVMASPIEQKVWTTLGAQPTSIPTPETYSGLQTGVVDAAENAPIIILGWKFYEPAKYYSLTEHQFFIAPVFMSDKTYQKLPPDLRDTVLECIREASAYEQEQDVAINEKALQDLKAKGCIINSDVDKESFINALKHVQDQVAKELGMEDILNLIRKALP